jgi:hypothetical protein
MAERETLLEVGNFGLSCAIGFSIVEQELGDGYDYSILTGSSAGTRSWSLVFKALPATLDGGLMRGTEVESRADYLWEFFCRRKAEGNSSFELVDPKDGKTYLVKFAEHELSYEMFALKLFATGLKLVQRQELGVTTLDDGSLGEFPEAGGPDI